MSDVTRSIDGQPPGATDVDPLLTWFSRTARDLPWRRTRDPWAVLVSETMLQQTQVARVVPRYAAFLDRWPTVRSCAASPVGEVVAAWAGLGYNRRAVNLHRCAQAVVERHGAEMPSTLQALLGLPGIGPYTARAVMAFAYETEHVGVVDTNAARVLARWAGRPLGAREVQAAADEEVPRGAVWAWNQAMLDLGATVCTKRAPACQRCPVRDRCRWGRSERAGSDPAVGSAGVGRGQSPFEGSDRQGRGRLVAALRSGPVALGQVARTMGWPEDPERAERVAATLVTDGLAVVDGDRYRLPGHHDR